MTTMRRGHLGFHHVQVVLVLLSVVARRAEKIRKQHVVMMIAPSPAAAGSEPGKSGAGRREHDTERGGAIRLVPARWASGTPWFGYNVMKMKRHATPLLRGLSVTYDRTRSMRDERCRVTLARVLVHSPCTFLVGIPYLMQFYLIHEPLFLSPLYLLSTLRRREGSIANSKNVKGVKAFLHIK